MMSTIEAWKSLLKQRKRDLIGGYFHYVPKGKGIYMGPVKDIKVRGKFLIVTTDWTAHIGVVRTGWKKVKGRNANTFRFNIEAGVNPLTNPNGVNCAGVVPESYEISFLKKGVEEPDFHPSMVEGL